MSGNTPSPTQTGLEEGGAPEPVKTSRRGAVLILVGIVAVLGMVLVFALAPKGTPADGVLPANPAGYPAPTTAGPALSGTEKLELAQYAGKPVVVNFWASWCTTCKAEAQTVADAAKYWADKGVVFVGIDSADNTEGAKAYEKQYGITYDSILDPDSAIAAKWRVTGYPETFFIDPAGRITSKFISSIDREALDENIQAILPK